MQHIAHAAFFRRVSLRNTSVLSLLPPSLDIQIVPPTDHQRLIRCINNASLDPNLDDSEYLASLAEGMRLISPNTTIPTPLDVPTTARLTAVSAVFMWLLPEDLEWSFRPPASAQYVVAFFINTIPVDAPLDVVYTLSKFPKAHRFPRFPLPTLINLAFTIAADGVYGLAVYDSALRHPFTWATIENGHLGTPAVTNWPRNQHELASIPAVVLKLEANTKYLSGV